jgi:hypothetical protein
MKNVVNYFLSLKPKNRNLTKKLRLWNQMELLWHQRLYGEARNVNNPMFWTSKQINDFRQKYNRLSAKNKKLGCILYQNVGTLVAEKKMEMKISKVGADYEIFAYGES